MKAKWRELHDPYRILALPRPDQDIWIMRDGWERPRLTWYGALDPAMNIVGLYWVPAVDGEGPPEWVR